jgi:cytosine/adenosine deaminase-related metal-dependent hydrolase
MLRIRAGSVHPVTAPPISDGAVLVGDDGRIAAVGPHSHVPAPPGTTTLEFPSAHLVPGLVNCHTHLELTHLAGQNAEREFPRWIRRVRQLKDATPPEGFDRAAEQGIREGWAAGVTCVAETGSTGAVMEALARLGGRGVVYQEVFGPDPAHLESSMAELEAAVARLRRLVSPQVRLGVSPHAPYTVSSALYSAVVEYARRAALPVAAHLAESREESEFVREGTGPFAEALRGRGIAVQPLHCSPVEHLARLGVVASGCLCVHCVQVSEADIAILARAGATIAHCPRSNRAHGHGAAPLAALRAAGIGVGLGTDSVVSVGPLDLWAEAEAAGFRGEDALRMLTIEGARALRWEAEIGSLEVGKAADLTVLSAYPPIRPSAAVLTAVSGRIVHRLHK